MAGIGWLQALRHEMCVVPELPHCTSTNIPGRVVLGEHFQKLQDGIGVNPRA